MQDRIRVLLLSVVVTGCGATSSDAARVRFANEFRCPEKQVALEELGGSSFRTSGCGQTAVYVCKEVTNPMAGRSVNEIPCVRNGGPSAPVAEAQPAPVTRAPAEAPPPAARTPADRLNELEELRSKQLITEEEYEQRRQQILNDL